MWSCKDIFFLRQLKESEVRACDSICVSSQSIFSTFPIPSPLALHSNRPSHQSPSLSRSLVMSSFSPQILLLSFPRPLRASPPPIPTTPPRPPSIFIPPSPSCWCHLAAPTAEEFIPGSGKGPYWGKLRALGGNHVVPCLFVYGTLVFERLMC